MYKKHKKNLRVMVFGVFDGLHAGHRAFLDAAKSQGDELVAVVARDSFARAYKKKHPRWNEKKRLAAVRQCSTVDRAVLADPVPGSYLVMKKYRPDVVALGYDQGMLVKDLAARMKKGEVPHASLVRIRRFDPSDIVIPRIRIPADARRVFRGMIFDAYHWRQKMFDGTYETFEMLERKPTADAIAARGGKIMILRQRQPGRAEYPSLPGGGIHQGETAFEAARRELLEEAGYEARAWRLFGEYFGNSKMYFHEYDYVARGLCKVARQKLDSGEKIKITWVTFDEFLNLARNPLFAVSVFLKYRMYEALLDPVKREWMRREIFG